MRRLQDFHKLKKKLCLEYCFVNTKISYKNIPETTYELVQVKSVEVLTTTTSFWIIVLWRLVFYDPEYM